MAKKDRPQFRLTDRQDLRHKGEKAHGGIIEIGGYGFKKPNTWFLFFLGIFLIAAGLYVLITGNFSMHLTGKGVVESDGFYARLIGIAIIFGGVESMRYAYSE